MIKLYKIGESGRLHYHEAWIHRREIVEHMGAVGDRGLTRHHRMDRSKSEEENLERVLAEARTKGFAPMSPEAHSVLLVEYSVSGVGSTADVAKRHRLERRLNGLLGWTGLGHCDGGSIGSGTMEACCYVVDFEVARSVVEKDLADSEFADYSRIFEEE